MKTLQKIVIGLAILSLIGTFLVYPMLPSKIPSHWNINWEIDAYAGKSFLFFTASLPIVFYLLLMVIPKIDPRKDSYQKHQKAYWVFSTFMMMFFIVLHWLTILVALKIQVNIKLFFSLTFGLLFIVIGNYMGQIRPNYTFGIRTPWTLADETVWKKTHRKGGIIFIATGLIFVLGGVLTSSYTMVAAMAFLLMAIIYLMVYSYREYKKIKL